MVEVWDPSTEGPSYQEQTEASLNSIKWHYKREATVRKSWDSVLVIIIRLKSFKIGLGTRGKSKILCDMMKASRPSKHELSLPWLFKKHISHCIKSWFHPVGGICL